MMTSISEQIIRLLVIQGPTASGKTEMAIRLAEKIGGEIINADSMQVYRGMDIGTAKPTIELRQRIPHFLLDLVTPEYNFSAADFRREAQLAIADIHSRGKRPIVVGGTGLYIRALLNGLVEVPAADEEFRRQLGRLAEREGDEVLLASLTEVDPVTAARLHKNDHVRIIRALEVFHQTGIPISEYHRQHRFNSLQYDTLKLGIQVERDLLFRRIDFRVEQMIADGLIEEVDRLLKSGYGVDLKSMGSIGYKEICSYLSGVHTYDEAVRLIKRNTRHYAKRQETWLKRDPQISWVEYPETFAIILNHVIAFYD